MLQGMPFLLVAAGAALVPSLAPAWNASAAVVLIYMLAGAAVSLELGWAGLPDFSIAAWFFAGAWCTAAIMHAVALPFWACAALAVGAVTVIALVITSPLLRLPREVFAMATLAIAMIVPGITAHQKFLAVTAVAIPAGDTAVLYDALIAILLVAGAIAMSIERSPLGLALRAGAEDRIVCNSIGLNTRRCRLLVVALSAAAAATAGCMLPAFQGAHDPAVGFDAIASIFAIGMIAGRRMSGAAIAAFIIAGIPQFVPALSEYRVVLAGAAILCSAACRIMSADRGGNTVVEGFNLAQPTGAGAE